MITSVSRRSGGPLMALVILLGSWALVRAALWQSPFPANLPDLGLPGFEAPAPVIAGRSVPTNDGVALVEAHQVERSLAPMPPNLLTAPLQAGPWMKRILTNRPDAFQISSPGFGAQGAEIGGDSSLAADHQILYAAGSAYAPSVTHLQSFLSGRDIRPSGPATSAAAAWPSPEQQRPSNRWGLDGWTLWRSGSDQAFAAAAPSPNYGASQAGVVLRYRINPNSSYRPQAYVRATKALVTVGESEIAAGLSARPLARLPVRGHAELRATGRPSTTEIRPAAFVTTEIPPQKLPAGLQASLYAQGGYVGGDFATAFADGQLKVDRDVAQFDLGTVRVGAGAWAGAQKGAARLDAGPSASVTLDRGPVPARLSVDYRVRLAGDAQPGSGIAVTLTTGF